MKSAVALALGLLATGIVAHPATSKSSQTSDLRGRAAVDLNDFRLKIGSSYTKSSDVEHSGLAALAAGDYVQAATRLVKKRFPLAQYRVVDDHYVGSSGVAHVNFKQVAHGIDIDNADFHVNVAKDGSIFSHGDSFFKGLIPLADPLGLAGLVRPLAALHGIARVLKLPISGGGSATSTGSRGSYILRGVSGVTTDPTARLVYYQTPAGIIVPAWRIETDLGDDWLVSYVDALAIGHILGVVNYKADATYNVFPWAQDNPTEGGRVVVANPADPKASEFTWQGDGSTMYPTTRGNNGIAQGNLDGDTEYLNEARPVSASQNFNFPLDLSATDPATYLNASVTQLWFTVNKYHDLLYKLGFTEKAGNFETNNNGAGGKGNDAAILNAQDGSGTNNANFASPPDGQAGRMRMYIWNLTSPKRDGALESGIVLHEYTHGLSTRLTGGPANSNCLILPESGGMGEGWSDFFATAIRVKKSNTRATNLPVGEWASGKANGIRAYPYSTNLRTNPNMFSTINLKTEVHAIGEVWATMLYEVLWNLIDKHGNTAADVPTFDGKGVPTDGKYLSMKIVMDGMALQPCNPTFPQARDAILDADKALTGGANQCQIWKGFAKRGLGSNALSLPLLKSNGQKIPAGVC